MLCDLIPGGTSKAITAGHAARVLDAIEPSGAVGLARHQLAAEFPGDLRRTGTQLSLWVRNKLSIAVRAPGTTLTQIYGTGPVIAAIVPGCAAEVARFTSRDQFAARNGTAPIEVSSGSRKIHRLSRRGNRRLNHAIYMAAVTQIRYRGTAGRAYYDRKIAEGKTRKEALRALKRRISDAIFAHLKADASRTAPAVAAGPGGQPGNDSVASAADSHPEHRLFGQATPEPATTLRPRRDSQPANTSARPVTNTAGTP